MRVNGKQKILAIVIAAAVLLSVGTAAFFQLRPSADEEISQMQSIVAEYTEDDGFMQPDNHEIADSEADALDQAAEDSMSSSVIDDTTQPGVDEPGDPGTTDPGTVDPGTEDPGDVVQPPDVVDDPTTDDPATPVVPEETHVAVEVRNWKQYSSSYPYDHMTSAEQALWLRLEAAAEDYMNNSAMDAIYSSAQNLYTTYSVRYGDLEMSREKAVELTQWFMSCNAQYWFLRPSILSTSKVLYLGVLDIGADGDDRAEITNQMFRTVDDWASSMSSATTVYQKVRAAHDRVVSEIGYQGGSYDQSVYSAFVERRSVCAGYAGAMSMLLNSAGVNTTVICSSNHAWNGVQMEDGNWYGLDATWDDSLSTYQFFLVSDANLRVADNTKEAHVVEGNAVSWAPALASYNYNASAYDNTGDYGSGAPAVPSNLHVEYIDEKSGRAVWDSIPGAEKYEFQVYRNSALCGSSTLTGTSIKLSGFSSTPMTVKVRAVSNSASGVEYSDWASIDYVHGAGTVSNSGSTTTQLLAPANIHVVETSDTYARLAWDAAENADKYEIQVYKDANYTVQKLSGYLNNTAVKLSGFSAGQTVYVQIRTIHTVNGTEQRSDWSKLSVTSQEVQQEISAPQNLMFQKKSGTGYRASWNAVEGATGYDVEVYKDAAMTQKTVSGTVSGTSVSFSNVKSDTVYYARVRAVGQGLTSEWTTGSFGEETPTISAPGNIAANKVDSTSCRITWDASENATKYQVQISYQSDFSTIAAETSVTKTALKLTQVKDKTYYIRVKAVGTVNGVAVESDWANVSYRK